MNLQEWRKQQREGEAVTLPSGLEVKLKRVSVLELVRLGKIPETLRPQVDQSLKSGALTEMNLKTFEQFAEIVALVCAACLADEQGGLTVEELPWGDQQEIFEWANKPAGKLATFRGQPAQPVDAALAGVDVRTAA